MRTRQRPKHSRSLVPAALAAAALVACIENEEAIVVREDGSVSVTLRAEGDAPDLANGYPLPLGGPWQPQGVDTAMWLRRIGDGPMSDAMAREAEDIHLDRDEQALELEVRAEFASAEAIPRVHAPDADPYATAYLERGARLDVREEGGRRVFTFERVYHGRDYHRLDPYSRLERSDNELVERFDDEDATYTEDEWKRLTRSVRGVFADVAELYLRDAILGLYTEGDASLAPSELPGLYDRVRQGASDLISVERLQSIRALLSDSDKEAAGALLEGLQAEFRAGIRRELELLHESGRITEPVKNALCYALEWGFTAQDAYGDLLDESFRVTVELPGTLVGGNFDETEGRLAVWEFDGDALLGGDLVLRATSVLE